MFDRYMITALRYYIDRQVHSVIITLQRNRLVFQLLPLDGHILLFSHPCQQIQIPLPNCPNLQLYQPIFNCKMVSKLVVWYSSINCESKDYNSDNLGSKLSICITTSSTLLVNKIYKVIQISPAMIIFTSFVAFREEFQSWKTTYTIPV